MKILSKLKNLILLQLVMLVSLSFNSLQAKDIKEVSGNNSEKVQDSIDLQRLTAPNYPTKFQIGCHCEIGDIVVQKGVMGSEELIIQRKGKYEELSSLNDLKSKKVSSEKSILTFSAANKTIDVAFTCEMSEVNSDFCNEGGCGEVLYLCDVHAKSKDGKKTKTYQKLNGNCVC